MASIALEKIVIAKHYGFCMGVKRAISIAEDNMQTENKVTILNEIVHNDAIVHKFRDAGVGQEKAIKDIANGTVIISAHGVSPTVTDEAEAKGLDVIDATCPLVIRIHKIVKKLADAGYLILHYGDPHHDETAGIIGHAPDRVVVVQNVEQLESLTIEEDKIALTAQTTASNADFDEFVEHVLKKFPDVEVNNTVCNATSQRQKAVIDLAPKMDMMLIVGSTTSANSNRLAQISKSLCRLSFMINSADEIETDWFGESGSTVKTVGLTAGASTPDFLIEGVIDRLKQISEQEVEVVITPRKTSKNRLGIS